MEGEEEMEAAVAAVAEETEAKAAVARVVRAAEVVAEVEAKVEDRRKNGTPHTRLHHPRKWACHNGGASPRTMWRSLCESRRGPVQRAWPCPTDITMRSTRHRGSCGAQHAAPAAQQLLLYCSAATSVIVRPDLNLLEHVVRLLRTYSVHGHM